MKLHPNNLDEAMHIIRQKCRQHSQIDIYEGAGVSKMTVMRLTSNKTKILRLDTFVKLCAHFEIELTIQIIHEHIRAA